MPSVNKIINALQCLCKTYSFFIALTTAFENGALVAIFGRIIDRLNVGANM